jgi:hypothetical protein
MKPVHSLNQVVRTCSLLAAGTLGACSGEITPPEEVETAQQGLMTFQRVLGYETPSVDWLLGPGSSATVSSTTTHTEGATALRVANFGWAQLQSARIGPIGSFSPSTASFDVRVDGSGSLPWGDCLFQFDSPSQGIFNAQAGQALLGGTARGTWRTVSVPLSAELATKLSSAADLSVRISITLPAGSTAIIDNYRFGSGNGGSSGGRSAIDKLFDRIGGHVRPLGGACLKRLRERGATTLGAISARLTKRRCC